VASASKPEFAAVARRAAADAGFDLCGVVAYPFPAVEHFERWIDSGAHGEMAYLAARNEAGELRRQRLETALPWARSVVVCALNYNPDAPYSTELHDPNKGWISRYALAGQNGKCTDYHDALFGRLRQIEEELHATFGDFHSRSYVDTGPIVERALAQAAGIGWIGKNTCLINERHRLGSWLVLGVIVTGYEIEARPRPNRTPQRVPHSSCLLLARSVGTSTLNPSASTRVRQRQNFSSIPTAAAPAPVAWTPAPPQPSSPPDRWTLAVASPTSPSKNAVQSTKSFVH
jgi:epoxyqueuosine reductase QueG